MTSLVERCPQRREVLVELRLVGVRVRMGEIELSHRVHRHDMEVGVGHLEPSDHQADASWGEHRHLRTANRMSNLGEVSSRGCSEIGPEVGFLTGHHKGVTIGQRADIEKAHTEVVFPQHS